MPSVCLVTISSGEGFCCLRALLFEVWSCADTLTQSRAAIMHVVKNLFAFIFLSVLVTQSVSALLSFASGTLKHQELPFVFMTELGRKSLFRMRSFNLGLRL